MSEALKPRLPLRAHRLLSSIAEWEQYGRPLTALAAQSILDEHEGWTNVQKGVEIVSQITELKALQKELKSSFSELEGSWRGALTHPLYLQAEERILELQDDLKGLI